MTTDLEHRLGLGSADGVKRALRTWADRDGETTPLGNAAADLIERQERTIADLTGALEIAAKYLPALPDRPPRLITEDEARQEREQVLTALDRVRANAAPAD